jgi:hypothetical protein
VRNCGKMNTDIMNHSRTQTYHLLKKLFPICSRSGFIVIRRLICTADLGISPVYVAVRFVVLITTLDLAFSAIDHFIISVRLCSLHCLDSRSLCSHCAHKRSMLFWRVVLRSRLSMLSRACAERVIDTYHSSQINDADNSSQLCWSCVIDLQSASLPSPLIKDACSARWTFRSV